jgi:indoleamine 2,3-dioxygenase
MLDDLGRDLPSLLEDPGFRSYARGLRIPEWSDARSAAGRGGPRKRRASRGAAAFAQGLGGPTKLSKRNRAVPALNDALNDDQPCEETAPALRLYYLRLGFLASAYINQVSQPRATVLPRNLAIPLCKACALMGRPPILSYDGYVLYNWKRFDPNGPIALGNLDTLQNFVHLYDEHWFILVHVEIEAIAAGILSAIDRTARALLVRNDETAEVVSESLREIASAVWRQVAVIRRIPEKMDPALYHRTFRPYIRFFENVVYEGVAEAPMHFRGETGAQSSIMPALVAFMKIRHAQSALTDHLGEMRRFMPPPHRQLIAELEAMPSIREIADPAAYNEVLEAMATFREVHHGWAQEYINRWVDDPRGTGGTPYMPWLRQLIEETRLQKL